jgi:hypothetical protein
MVSHKDTLKERLKQKIFDEEMKVLWKEIDEIPASHMSSKEYREFIKKDRHPMSYTVKEEIEEWWRSAPLRLNLDKSLSIFWMLAWIYVAFWCSIGLYVAIQFFTA